MKIKKEMEHYVWQMKGENSGKVDNEKGVKKMSALTRCAYPSVSHLFRIIVLSLLPTPVPVMLSGN